MHAFDEEYLEDAQACFGEMLDHAVRHLGVDSDLFISMLAISGVARQLERGNPKYVAGMAGAEIAERVINAVTGACVASAEPSLEINRSSWYWTGWVLARYQWRTCMSFAKLASLGLSPSAVELRYVLHEADVSAFDRWADGVVSAAKEGAPTNLKRIRKARKMTQSQLAQASGVSLRMIQLYEQRQSNIDQAAASTVAKIARVLGCSMEDLLEEPLTSTYECAFVEI